MDIEEVAEKTPERIIKVAVNPLIGIQGFHLRNVCFGLELEPALMKAASAVLKSLYRLFVDYDCSMVEINPLIITEDNKILALDAKMDIDSNALFRHPDVVAMHDPDEDDPVEAEAAKFDLNYINLDGNVGNMVNGAGLAMATMDIMQAPRRRSGQLPRCRRRRQCRDGGERFPHHSQRSQGQGHSDQHLRRYPPLRCPGQGCCPGCPEGETDRAGRCPDGRDQCRGRAQNPRRIRVET